MIPFRISSESFDRGAEALRRYNPRTPASPTRRAFQAGISAVGDVIVAKAKQTRAFRDRTGNLRRGITHIPDPSNPIGRIITVRGPAKEYAAAVEARSPFIEPAVRTTRTAQVRAFDRAASRHLRD